MKTPTLFAVLLGLGFGCGFVRAQQMFTPFVTGTLVQHADGTVTAESGLRLSLTDVAGGGIVESRAFIGFSLPDFGGQAGPAQLDLTVVNYAATTVIPQFGSLAHVWDVSSTLAELTAGSPTAATFHDLGSGTFYDQPGGSLFLPPDPFNLGTAGFLLYADWPGNFPGYLNAARPEVVFFGLQLTSVPFQTAEQLEFTSITLEDPRLFIYRAEPPFQPVPEPATMGIFAALGLVAAAAWRNYRRVRA